MRTPDLEIIITDDGSHTLYVPLLDETFHSTHGAIQESRHIFIRDGLEYLIDSTHPDKLKILEVGFGTGLNALLTIEYCEKHAETNIEYTALEPFPLGDQIIQNLNYYKEIGTGKNEWDKIHNASWNESTMILPNFKILKLETSIENFETDQVLDLIYFDAFAPGKQPDIWDASIFEKLNRMMNKGAILTTYCAQGQFKRTLKSVGFDVESLPGPPGKFQMVRASKV
jgi:tRNA U34 5-methylaminomethyl-2-thiouridine-forming methyltransferase MnmC